MKTSRNDVKIRIRKKLLEKIKEKALKVKDEQMTPGPGQYDSGFKIQRPKK